MPNTQPTQYDGTTHVLPEPQMRELGFTDRREAEWYLCAPAGLDGVTLNITIDKATGNYRELVMDEDFGQPYHYGRYGFAEPVTAAIDAELQRLNAAGLTIDVNHALYGVAS